MSDDIWYKEYQTVQAELEEAYDAINTYMEHLGTLWRIAVASKDIVAIEAAEDAHEKARLMLIVKDK